MSSANDLRGHVHRRQRLMPDADARAFLRTQKVAHVATVDDEGWPYVIPLIYIYEGEDRLWVHTGNHGGHFERNIERHPRVCIEVSEMGPVHPGRTYACQSALVYSSVVTFGRVRLVESLADKTWCFDRVLAKYGDPAWSFASGVPADRSDRALRADHRNHDG